MTAHLNFDEAWVADYCKRTGQPNPLGEVSAEKPAKPSKYHNEPVVVDGIRFPSIREAKRYGELKLMVRSGDICGFSRQQPFLLPGGITYRADFVVLGRDGCYIVEDAKGMRTKEYKVKKRLMKSHLGIDIVEV